MKEKRDKKGEDVDDVGDHDEDEDGDEEDANGDYDDDDDDDCNGDDAACLFAFLGAGVVQITRVVEKTE